MLIRCDTMIFLPYTLMDIGTLRVNYVAINRVKGADKGHLLIEWSINDIVLETGKTRRRKENIQLTMLRK